MRLTTSSEQSGCEISLQPFQMCNLTEVNVSDVASQEDLNQRVRDGAFLGTLQAAYTDFHYLRPIWKDTVEADALIGVGMTGIGSGAVLGLNLEEAAEEVKKENARIAGIVGINCAARTTTIKPSGTISQLTGVSSGMHFPTFKYAIRRMRVGNTTPICQVLKDAGVPHEPDVFSEGTTVFSFPICNENAREAKAVSAWEQFAILAMLQREWADNMVSCTVYFDPITEGNQIEYMLSQFIPVIKSVSMLPHTDVGAYPQMPYEGITKEQYEELLSTTPRIDWSKFGGSDGADSKFCNNDTCTI